jgi:hypothetical protein
MLEDMGIRNLAENTQLSYLQQISAYARHFGRSPEGLGPVCRGRRYLRRASRRAPTSGHEYHLRDHEGTGSHDPDSKFDGR